MAKDEGSGPIETTGDEMAELAEAIKNIGNPEPKPEEQPATEDVEESSQEEAVSESESNEDNPESGEEADAGAEAESPEAESEEEPEAGQEPEEKGLLKRVNKLTARAKSAEEERDSYKKQAEELEARLAELEEKVESKQAAAPPFAADNPLAGLKSEEEVENRIREARRVKRWCEQNAEGTTIKDESGREIEYTPEQIREMRFRAEDVIEDYGPRQKQAIQQDIQSRAVALQEFPWWKDRTHPNYALAQNVLKGYPWLKQVPGHMYALGLMVEGHLAKEARKQKPVAKAPPKAPKQPAKPAAAPRKVEPKQVKSAEADSRFMETLDVHDLAAALQTRM